MRRFALYVVMMLAALALTACVRPLAELEPGVVSDAFPEGKPVTITFSVPVAGVEPGTKTIGETGILNTLHLAVFGSSGYLKEYVKAVNLGLATDEEGQAVTTSYTDPYGTSHTDVPVYKYSATLSLAEKDRIIHFIGNGPDIIPFDYDTTVLATLLSDQGEGGFWQTKRVSRIGALKNANGQYIDAQGNVITDGKGYVPDEYTREIFKNVPLVRNWAKISISADAGSQFVPKSFAVINVPTKGTIAPMYRATNGRLTFVEDYEKKTFGVLDTVIHYPSSLPSDAQFDGDVPLAGEFENPSAAGGSGKVIPYNDGLGRGYLFERPKPGEAIKEATFLIVYGHFNPEDEAMADQRGDYYYKIDLADEGEYYPVYRNFTYVIQIRKVESVGHPDPESAAQSVGGVAISADVKTSHLGDISDGQARMVVQPWMAQSFHVKQTNNNVLNVKFFSDVTVDNPEPNTDYNGTNVADPDANPVTWELGEGDVITDVSIGAPSGGTGEEEGWRNITFSTDAPSIGTSPRTQSLRIKACYRSFGQIKTLYRDILITILPTQKMQLSLSRPEMESLLNEKQVLTIAIPDGLPESMFPLSFIIEPEDRTLMPELGANIPVISGKTLSTDPVLSSRPTYTFQFVRTLTYDEYNETTIDTDDHGIKRHLFDTEFVSTRAENETTIWVYNEYFEKNSIAFTNGDRYFQNMGFTTPFRKNTAGQWNPVPLHFDVEWSIRYGYPEITLSADGLTIDELEADSEVEKTSAGNVTTYIYTPSSDAQNFTCTILEGVDLSDLNQQVSVSATAAHYRDSTVRSHHFRNFRFMDGIKSLRLGSNSNVMFEYISTVSGKAAPFGYCDDADSPAAVSLLMADRTTPFTGLTLPNPLVTNSESDPTYHEIGFKTKDGSTAALSFLLSAPGYVEETVSAGRFEGDKAIANYNSNAISTSNILKPNNNQYFGKNGKKDFTHSANENGYNVTVEFDRVPTLNSTTALWLEPTTPGEEDTFWMKVKSNNDHPVYYIEITFSDGNVPETMEINEDRGRLEKYRGTSEQRYIWNLYRASKSGGSWVNNGDQYHTIQFKSRSSINITKIIIRTEGNGGATYIDP